jgi:cytochrome c oxidase subunit 2
MKKSNTLIVALACLAAVSAATWLLLAAPALTGNEINMTRGVTPLSQTHFDLHMTILWICVVIGVLVFTAMFTSIVLHRKSRGHEPAQFSHSTKAEITWTVIPVLILVGMAVPATKALVQMETAADAEITVKVTGFQWRWKYDYLDEDISFVSSLDDDSNYARRLASGVDPRDVENYLLNVDRPLVLPVDTKVKFLITADDVIHAWWVPEFGWKKDAIPGFINEGWVIIEEPGIYRGQCAELCGQDHGFMPIVVEALPRDEYEAWVLRQRGQSIVQAEEATRDWSYEELMDRGESVYAGNCASCHQAEGQGLTPAFPALAGSSVATGPVAEHIALVLNGREGTAMAGFGKLLSDTDIAAALTYTRNAFGNETGDLVQPREVSAARNSETRLTQTNTPTLETAGDSDATSKEG